MLYFEPNFVDEALVLLDRFGDGARPLAGGTRLGFRLRDARPDGATALINLKRIAEMQSVARSGALLRIGALVTANQLATHPVVREHAGVLADAARSLGARQLRSVATLGGNICSGDPLSDLTTALLACDARCEITTLQEGPVQVALDLLVGKAPPVLASGELLTAVEIPLVPGTRSSYQKMSTRRAFEFALVAVAASARFRGAEISEARIALAGAGTAPKRARAAESVLAGKQLDSDTITAAARCAADSDAQPLEDRRASKEYRRHLVAVLTARALRSLAPANESATGK